MKKVVMYFVFMILFTSLVLAVPAMNQNKSPNQNIASVKTQNESTIQVEVQSQNQNKIQVQIQKGATVKIKSGNFSVECNRNLTQEQSKNQTKIHAQLSNGKKAEIKIMPETASETAINRLRLKVCSEENNCTIQLKEVQHKNNLTMAYEVKAQKQYKILGLFKTRSSVKAEINAENGEILSEKKPWWAFLASETEQ